MSTTDLHDLTIHEAGPLLRQGQISPVELTRAFLARIEQLDHTLQAYITVLPDRAMAAARGAEAEMLRGEYRGPLHGIPIALKDLYDTQGIRTTASSRVMADRVPTEDATTTERLESAGAILLGKFRAALAVDRVRGLPQDCAWAASDRAQVDPFGDRRHIAVSWDSKRPMGA